MAITQLIETENLEKLALNCLKNNPNPKRGPKTIEGKKKALANLKRKTKAEKSPSLDPPSSDFNFRFIDLKGEKGYSRTQKKFYKHRFRDLIKHSHNPNYLTTSMIHNLILMELDIKNQFRQLTNPKLTLKQAQFVRKMLRDSLDVYKKLYSIVEPELFGQDLKELFDEVFPENEPISNRRSPASCHKDWLFIRGINPSEIDITVEEQREKLIHEYVTSLRKEWEESDEDFMMKRFKREKLAEMRKSYTTGKEEMY